MLKRFLIVCVFLFSYAGAIAHSIVPHHHHVSHKEAKEHHHHNHASHSHGKHDGSKKEQSHAEGAYFLTHASNTDVVVNHFSFDNPVKGKKLQFSVQPSEPLLSAALSDYNIFHPPSNDRLLSIAIFYSCSLRAPPFFIV